MKFIPAALLLSVVCTAQTNDNVLVIVADDLGVDQVGCYTEGTSPPPTPNIDALAAGGVLFRNCWANTVCSPTRALLHTGRYSFRNGVGSFITPGIGMRPGTPLPASELTLPDVLKIQLPNYDHALIGKWHLDDPTNLNSPNTVGGWNHFAGSTRGAVQDYYRWQRTVNGVQNWETRYATDKQTNDTINWIGTRTGPWVCILSYNTPHLPYQSPPPSRHTRPSQATTAERYAAMVEAMDNRIGALLTSPVIPPNTWVIFCGDNGTPPGMSVPPFATSSIRVKGSPYEGGVNVPLIIKGPGVLNPGREVPQLVGLVDLWATILEMVGTAVATEREIDSLSILPILTTIDPPGMRKFVFSERFEPTPALTDFRTVRGARYKLIRWTVSGMEEMYDLCADPFETTDLLSGTLTARQQRVLNQLRRQIANPQ